MSIHYKDMESNNTFDELRNCRDDVPIFRRLISVVPSHDTPAAESAIGREWRSILTHIVEITSRNTELGNERVLLACHAFYVLLATRCDSRFLDDTVTRFQESDTNDLYFLGMRYTVSDLELFKLSNAHGYLQTNRKNMYHDRTLSIMFDVIYRNCLKYTRYSYFAYKVLHMWLKRTSDTSRFWYQNDIILEQKLEAVIFSNWSNALNDVSKQNAQIFNTYLRIMSEKYKGFLKYVFEMCITSVSWQNETKYTILTEVCQLWDDIEAMTTKDFLFGLCTSLTKNSLRCGGTKLYLVILRKLSEVEWKKTFGETVKFFIDRWESGEHEDHNALQSLFKYWLEPTIDMRRDTLTFLWELCGDSQGYFFRSHLQRVAAKLHVELPRARKIDRCINDREEIVRLNAFAVDCHRAADLIDDDKADPFVRIKEFLWFNANAATILMREGIVKYFRIFYSSILKTISVRADRAQFASEFTEWLYQYFLDCFEIGSCYQRKILALNLYRALLSFTNGNLHNSCAHHRVCLRNSTTIDKYLRTVDNWKFTSKRSLFVLLRLILDSALDVRQLATALILEYFEKNILSATEEHVLYRCAWEHCNSSKFYKIESGAALVKIIAHWLPFNQAHEYSIAIFSNNEHNIVTCSSYSEFLLSEARCQLTQMRQDILKAVVQNRPFYGALTALLAIAFRDGPENWILTPRFTTDLLNLLKEAVEFFLSALSTKTSNTAYSSSFAEMGLAIDEKIKSSEIDGYSYDELQLSPAHQLLITCIWMSLKVSCEIVNEIGILMQSDAEVRYSMDIIVMVLLKCRHKGVVESAGVAIANLSRHLYGREEYRELPRTHLTSLLEEDTGKLLHLTRRGAGLSIMFHKLVVSDNRRDRPTVHFAVRTLLRSLGDFSMVAVRNVEPGQDSPWAKRLHFLRALVADKEIHAQLIPYMEDICLTCFAYMESDVWTVRNASLQLYGAVVPRLVGQCSGRSGRASDFGDGYSVNHFVTHYPRLADRARTQLRAVARLRETSGPMLRSYASVTHPLLLLSRMWTAGCDLVDYPSTGYARAIESHLPELFANPIARVRQLAAKAFAALTPASIVRTKLRAFGRHAFSCRDDNLSHGYLLTVGHLTERLNDTVDSDLSREAVEKSYSALDTYHVDYLRRYRDLLKAWRQMYEREVATRPCYMLETLFLRESKFMACRTPSTDRSAFDSDLSIIERVAPSQRIQPGFFQFVEEWARLYATSLEQTSDVDPEILRRVLSSDCVEPSIGFLNGLSYSASSLEFSLRYLISMKPDHRHQLLLDELATFALRAIKRVASRDDVTELDDIIEELGGLEPAVATNANVIRARNALILAFSRRDALINVVLSYVLGLCADNRQYARSMAAEYVELALRRYSRLESDVKLTIVRCCLILLKDEIAEIRETVSTALQRYTFRDDGPAGGSAPSHQSQHEEVVYQRLLRDAVRRQFVIDPRIDDSVDFIRYFTRAIRDTVRNGTIENPFYHGDVTFHKEETKFLNLCFLHARLVRDNARLGENGDTGENRCDVTRAIQTGRELRERAGFSYDDLRTVLYIKEMDYLARKRDVVQTAELI